jgi:hypothetical protein
MCDIKFFKHGPLTFYNNIKFFNLITYNNFEMILVVKYLNS